MDTVEQLRQLVATNPATTTAIAAATLGVSRQRISQIANKHGIKLRDGRMDKASIRDFQWKNHFGGTDRLSSNFIGGASELTACADLLRRGVPVYRALTSVSACDLIADVSGALLRIEVRSAKRNQDGRLAYPTPKPGRYDVLALVEPNGQVTYRPRDGVEWPGW